MRIAVVGAGAMGSLYGGMFHDAGHDVVMVDRNTAIVEAIAADGMRIERSDGKVDTYRVSALTAVDPTSKSFDLVLFQVKGFATESAAAGFHGVVTDRTTILTLQNGLGNEEVLRRAFPSQTLLIGISVHSAAMTGPGRTLHSGVRATWIGPSRQADFQQAEQIAAVLAGSGYEAFAESESAIRREVFSKWVLNCGSLPLAALTCLPTTMIAQTADALAVADSLTREACRVAALEGFQLDADERVAYNQDLFRTAGGKASMLQDIEAGRKTEIDTITGAAVRLAGKHGITLPLNELVYHLVCAREVAMGIRPNLPIRA